MKYHIEKSRLAGLRWWYVLLGTEYVTGFRLKRDAIAWILEQEKKCS